MFDKLHGKELSYNNLLDVDAAVNLMNEFTGEQPTFAILKHNNACGFAQRESVHKAYIDALAGDPVSAFGGVLICNTQIDAATANEIGRTVSDAAVGCDEIAKNVTSVATVSKDTTAGAANCQAAARELSVMAADLQSMVAKFKTTNT